MQTMFKRLGNVIENSSRAFGYLSAWLVMLMMMLIIFEVFMRYVVRRTPMIADEISAYMLVAIAFLGMAYTWQERAHVRITSLINRLPIKIASGVRLGTLILALGMVILLCVSSYGYLSYSFRIGLKSSTNLHLPLQVPQMPVLVGFIFFALVLLVDIVKVFVKIRSGKKVEENIR